MDCTDYKQRYFLTNSLMGLALSIPFMRTINPLGVGVIYSATVIPLGFFGLTPAPFLGMGLGLMGRSFQNISPLVEFCKVGPVTSWSSRLFSLTQPFITHWKPILQGIGGICLTKVAVSWAGERQYKKGCE